MTAATRTTLVLGGARSGKSRHAQMLAERMLAERMLAEQGGRSLIFVATAQAFDDEMRDRIARHRSDRDDRWTTVEAPLDLAGAIRAYDAANSVLLIDCLTLWVSNLLLAGADLEAAGAELVEVVRASSSMLILVSNEVGFGIVPDNALARRFRDAAGRLNQQLAAACDATDLVVAGIAMRIRG